MLHSFPIFIVLSIYFCLGNGNETALDYYRRKYQEKFEKRCRKYYFVERYEEIMKSLPSRYLIFVFHKSGYSNGGVGDRLSGLITAIAHSLRFKRLLLIQGDKAFGSLFKPLYFSDKNGLEFSWGNWTWSGWNDDFTKDATEHHCVNPDRPTAECLLDHDFPHKIIKYYGNRCYLCRWFIDRNVDLGSELYEQLKLTQSDNLFEVAGCMLRLAMFPTRKLWALYFQGLRRQFFAPRDFRQPKHFILPGHRKEEIGDLIRFEPMESRRIHFQIGVHFRCGDSSFKSRNPVPNPQCVVLPNITWKGTNHVFSSMDSPVDLGRCAQLKLAQYYQANHSNERFPVNVEAAVYLASDYEFSFQQMRDQLQPQTRVIYSEEACHIDLRKDQDCSSATLAQWFLYAMSDLTIARSMAYDKKGGFRSDIYKSDYIFKSMITQIDFYYVSAFSRYAMIYGLNTQEFYFGTCTTANSTLLAHVTQGNWICSPKNPSTVRRRSRVFV